MFPCVAVHAPSPGRQVGKKLASVGGDEPARVVLGGPKPLDVLSILEQAIVGADSYQVLFRVVACRLSRVDRIMCVLLFSQLHVPIPAGMRKRGKRFVTVPFHLWQHEAPSLSWASDLPSGTTLYIELSVASVKFHTPADEVVSAPPAPAPGPAFTAQQRPPNSQPPPPPQQPQQAPPSQSRSSRSDRTSRLAAAAEAVEDESVSSEVAPPPATRRATKAATKRDARFDDLVEYLQQMGLDEYTPEFVEQDIQLADLALLSETELSQIVTKIGPRRRLIASLAAHHQSAGTAAAATVTIPHRQAAPPPPHSRSIPERRVEADHSAPIPQQREAPADESESLRGMQTLSREKALAYARSEFDRGAEEMLQRCRVQMTQLKETANARYREVEEDLEARAAENESLRAAVARANRMLQDAHDRLQQSEAEKAELVAQSKEWAGRVRAASHEQMGASLRAGMDQVFEQLSALIAEDQIYDGALVLRHIRSKMKAVTTAFLQSPSR